MSLQFFQKRLAGALTSRRGSWRKPGLFLLLGLCILATACGEVQGLRQSTPETAPLLSIDIDPDHQACSTAADCVLIYIDCSGCGCGQAVNGTYREIYEKAAREVCSEYTGPVCEVFCPEVELVCEAGRCEVLVQPE